MLVVYRLVYKLSDVQVVMYEGSNVQLSDVHVVM